MLCICVSFGKLQSNLFEFGFSKIIFVFPNECLWMNESNTIEYYKWTVFSFLDCSLTIFTKANTGAVLILDILTTVSLKRLHNENIAREIELKKAFCDACFLLSMKRKLELSWNCWMMTMTKIIGVSITTFECTGQHAKKIQPNNKNRFQTKKQKKKRSRRSYEKKILRRERQNIRVHEF